MLKESDLAILKELYDSEDRQVLVSGNKALIGDKEYPASVAQRFLAMTCIREVGTELGITTYEMTPRGWQILANPEIQAQLTAALGFGAI